MTPNSKMLSAVAAALMIGVGATWATAAPGNANARTLSLRANFAQATTLDLGDPGPSIGDEQVVSGNLLDSSGHAAGTFGFTCKWVGFASGTALEACSGWGSIAGGQVTVQGMSSSDTQHHTWAITGGTGAYRAARGQVLITDLNDTASDVTLEFATPRHA